jgi:transposase InsO family protein
VRTPSLNPSSAARDELLNETLFRSLAHTRTVLEAWRAEYNEVRPHSAIGDRTPLSLIHLPRQHVEAPTRPEILS